MKEKASHKIKVKNIVGRGNNKHEDSEEGKGLFFYRMRKRQMEV